MLNFHGSIWKKCQPLKGEGFAPGRGLLKKRKVETELSSKALLCSTVLSSVSFRDYSNGKLGREFLQITVSASWETLQISLQAGRTWSCSFWTVSSLSFFFKHFNEKTPCFIHSLKNPITETENGFLKPKYYIRVSEVKEDIPIISWEYDWMLRDPRKGCLGNPNSPDPQPPVYEGNPFIVYVGVPAHP